MAGTTGRLTPRPHKLGLLALAVALTCCRPEDPPAKDRQSPGESPVTTAPPAGPFAPGREGTWRRITYAGPRHATTPGPWAPGQGSDRTEWIAAFGCSPVNAKFMLQCTDLGRLVYTNTRHGGVEFVPAAVPQRYGSMVAFHPRDPHTAFALFAASPAARPGLGGWWITSDEGETWRHLLATEPWRAQKQTFAVHPETGDFLVGTRDDGLLHSSDGGKSWRTLAFPGKRIWTAKFAHDGSLLYVIVARENNPRWNDWSKGGGELHAIPFRNGLPEAPARLDEDDHWWDVDPDPRDAEAGVLVLRQRQLLRFARRGRERRDITPVGMDRIDYCVINPANPDHLVAGAAGTLLSWRFRWTADGGRTWAMPREEDGWIVDLVDYGPANHLSPQGRLPGGDLSVGAERPLHAFVPGDPKALLYWGSNMIKGPYRSDNYGADMKPFAHGGNFKQASQLSASPDGQRLAVALNEYGFVLSDDGGRTWRGYHKHNTPAFPQHIGSGQYWSYRSSYGVAIDPANPRVAIGAFGFGPTHILRSEDFGGQWRTVHTLEAPSPDAIPFLFAPSRPSRLYADDLVSDDGGRSFSPIAHRVSAVSASNHDLILSKPNPRTMRWSADGGKAWHDIPPPPSAADGQTLAVWPGKDQGVAIDPSPAHDPARGGALRLLCAGEGGAWEFLAASDAWRPLPIQPFPQSPYGEPAWTRHMLFDSRPGKASHAYAFGGSIGWQRGEMGYRTIFRSTDGGRSWEWLADDPRRGELPDYLDVTCTPTVDGTGILRFHDTAGLYVLDLRN